MWKASFLALVLSACWTYGDAYEDLVPPCKAVCNRHYQVDCKYEFARDHLCSCTLWDLAQTYCSCSPCPLKLQRGFVVCAVSDAECPVDAGGTAASLTEP